MTKATPGRKLTVWGVVDPENRKRRITPVLLDEHYGWHSAFEDGIRWRLCAQGVEIEGGGIERTPGEPITVKRIWEAHRINIDYWSQKFAVHAATIIACIATESRGNPKAQRQEPGFLSDKLTPNKVSAGLMQTLLSTAREAIDDPDIDRWWMLKPNNSIRAGAAYMHDQRRKTRIDLPKVAAAYNAGGVYHQAGAANRWKMRCFPIGTGEHIDRFVKWFNDAVAMLGDHPNQPMVPWPEGPIR